MYLFLVFILLINIFLMSKVVIFLLEFLLICVILPLMNFSNKLNQTKYRLELHKIRIPNDENGWDFVINNENEEENDIKLNDFTFIDNKLD